MKTLKSLFTLTALCGAFAVGPTVLVAADFDENPTPVKTPPPSYPTDLQAQKVEGLVLLKVSISTDGAVEACEVKKSTHSGFERSALDAVKTWKFKPAKKDGAAVPAKILLPVKFNSEG